MSTAIKGSALAGEAKVTPDGDLSTVLRDGSGNAITYAEGDFPTTPIGILGVGMNDGTMRPHRADRWGNLGLAWHNPQFSEMFEGGTVSPTRWLVTAATMAAAQATVTGLTINSGNITTVSTGYLVRTTRLFTRTQRSPIQFKCRARLEHYINSVIEIGFGDASAATGVNTTGAYFQVTTGGVLQPVVTYNSVDRAGSSITFNPAKYYTFDILIDDDEAIFTVQDTETEIIISSQTIKLPGASPRMLSATQIPAMLRLYNTGVAPSAAPHLIATYAYVGQMDANLNASHSDLMSAWCRSALENPFTGVQAAQFVNSAAPSNATLSNTAAGYNTLGGLFSFAAVAGAATDYQLFGFQTPANLQIEEIEIETWNTGAPVTTTPHLLVWGLVTQLTAVSLATAGQLRYALGSQSLPVAAAIGANATRITKTFKTPVLCSSGRFVGITLRMPVASATASQVIQGHVSVSGKWLN